MVTIPCESGGPLEAVYCGRWWASLPHDSVLLQPAHTTPDSLRGWDKHISLGSCFKNVGFSAFLFGCKGLGSICAYLCIYA